MQAKLALIFTGVCIIGLSAVSIGGAVVLDSDKQKITEDELLTEVKTVNNTDGLKQISDKYRAREDDPEVKRALEVISELSSVETDTLDVTVNLTERTMQLESASIGTTTEEYINVATCSVGLDRDKSPIQIVVDSSEDSIIVDLEANGQSQTVVATETNERPNSEDIGRLPIQNEVEQCTI